VSRYGVKIDPAAVITNRVELDLDGGGLRVDRAGIDWGDAMVSQYLAQQRIGESAVAFRIPNRTISIPIFIGAKSIGAAVTLEEQSRRELQQKVALLQREGGVLLRQREGGAPLYADIMDATLTLPDVYGENAGVEPNVILKLSCLPDFYGDEVELTAVEQAGQVVSILEQGGTTAVIAGDFPARTRIVVTDKSGQNQKGLLWGFRVTQYNSASTGLLVYDAKDMTAINSASNVGNGESYSGTVVALGTARPNVWHPLLSTDLVAGAAHLTHLGSYRVWARVFTGATSMRLAWSSGGATAPIYNDAQQVIANGWYMLDLGEIRLDEPPTASTEHWWRGYLQLYGPGNGCFVDRIWFQPISDGGGKLRATVTPEASVIVEQKNPSLGVNGGGAGVAWTNPNNPVSGQVAQVELTPAQATQKLKLTGLGFNIPAGAVIHGFSLAVAHSCNVGSQTVNVALITASAESSAEASGEQGMLTYGTASDLWGRAWTATEVNSPGFGIALWTTANVPAGVPAIQQISYLWLNCFWTFAGAAETPDSVIYGSRKGEVRYDGAVRQDTTSNSYVSVSQITGDLARLPPSNLENRTAQLFLKPSRGDLTPNQTDPGIDKIQAQVFYRPCYIGRL
jgi:hypothetical protein